MNLENLTGNFARKIVAPIALFGYSILPMGCQIPEARNDDAAPVAPAVATGTATVGSDAPVVPTGTAALEAPLAPTVTAEPEAPVLTPEVPATATPTGSVTIVYIPADSAVNARIRQLSLETYGAATSTGTAQGNPLALVLREAIRDGALEMYLDFAPTDIETQVTDQLGPVISRITGLEARVATRTATVGSPLVPGAVAVGPDPRKAEYDEIESAAVNNYLADKAASRPDAITKLCKVYNAIAERVAPDVIRAADYFTR